MKKYTRGLDYDMEIVQKYVTQVIIRRLYSNFVFLIKKKNNLSSRTLTWHLVTLYIYNWNI